MSCLSCGGPLPTLARAVCARCARLLWERHLKAVGEMLGRNRDAYLKPPAPREAE